MYAAVDKGEGVLNVDGKRTTVLLLGEKVREESTDDETETFSDNRFSTMVELGVDMCSNDDDGRWISNPWLEQWQARDD